MPSFVNFEIRATPDVAWQRGLPPMPPGTLTKWRLSPAYDATPVDAIRDFARYPELRWLNRFHLVPPVLLAAGLFFVGGAPALVWGFFVSTVVLWHATFAVNSLNHTLGTRRYATADTSRNNALLALVNFGEGWHNNHHHYRASARQGFFWWEIDVSWYALRTLAAVGLVHDLRRPTHEARAPAGYYAHHAAQIWRSGEGSVEPEEVVFDRQNLDVREAGLERVAPHRRGSHDGARRC